MIDVNLLGFGYQERAIYAANPEKSLGRLYPEKKSLTRHEFQRDRDRIIHTTAFRRLKDKTQVFFYQNRDHYRTRLMHTIEVSQIARSLARALNLDEDLAEGIALAHDFGHPPFGHAGENVLQDLLCFCGGFDHNIQSLRVVTELEHSYVDFDGINLTWESLEGLIAHNGPILKRVDEKLSFVPKIFHEYCKVDGLNLSAFASLESQVAAIADDIAYDAHDIDDSLRSGLLTFDMLEEVTFLKNQLSVLRNRYRDLDLDRKRLVHEIVRRQITAMVEDVITVAQTQLAALKPQSIEDVRLAGRSIVNFSEDMATVDREIKNMLHTRVYKHPDIMSFREKASQIIRDLFEVYMSDPEKMCGSYYLIDEDSIDSNESVKARRVGDYLAGMTDNYAIEAHRRLFDGRPIDLPKMAGDGL
ncbi:deoxyguanosinetriphosphate triphosphohydrolase [Candidatus Liberibacter sp.]|uniref:deoxyguanosinetriphosphate triphosphohydrolase n=1 Tax=Candidatus Liberibacter sp. TaxID=34022 RepID=UPI0015F4FF8B|nr:deoxyguanosinetriphosphate triphosphohydrolase [Candidatus Liberibacter sp.]MBA5724383.1 deoxyguanosinetriphosphate triphosphohydrolase [Candidatus Liberibacter sp.]